MNRSDSNKSILHTKNKWKINWGVKSDHLGQIVGVIMGVIVPFLHVGVPYHSRCCRVSHPSPTAAPEKTSHPIYPVSCPPGLWDLLDTQRYCKWLYAYFQAMEPSIRCVIPTNLQLQIKPPGCRCPCVGPTGKGGAFTATVINEIQGS